MLRYLLLSVLLLSPLVHSAIDVFEFDTDAQRERYRVLVEELRCPKCQNQNLAGSNSEISIDLRRELHRMLLAGKSDDEIKAFMVDRYGEFVLYRPPLKHSTLVLWLLPVGLLVIGASTILLILRQRRKVKSEPSLSSADQDRLKSILESDEKP